MSTTTHDNTTDVDVTTLESLDFEPACEAPAGTHPASITLTCRNCGYVHLFCPKHLRKLRRHFNSRDGRRVMHGPCGHQAPTIDELLIVRPL